MNATWAFARESQQASAFDSGAYRIAVSAAHSGDTREQDTGTGWMAEWQRRLLLDSQFLPRGIPPSPLHDV